MASKQLEFANGGFLFFTIYIKYYNEIHIFSSIISNVCRYVMHDEACTHYVSMIDQVRNQSSYVSQANTSSILYLTVLVQSELIYFHMHSKETSVSVSVLTMYNCHS